MSQQIVTLKIAIQTEGEVDLEYLAKLTQHLRSDLLQLDVGDVQLPVTGKAPEGSKGDVITWGQLIIALAASGGVFTTLITLLQTWIKRHESYTLTLEIDGDKLEIKGISPQEQKRLTDEWLSRHPIILIAK